MNDSINKEQKFCNKIYNFCLYFLSANHKELLAVVAVFIYFYYLLANFGISTHDDLAAIATYKGVSFTECLAQMSFERWGGAVMGIFPVWLQVNVSDNLYIWQLFSIIGLAFACFTGFHVVYRHIDEKIAWSALLLFVIIAQFTGSNNGLYAYGWCYRYHIAWMFIAIDLYLFYLKTHKKIYYISSAVFYLLASMQYEAFIIFGFLLFIIDLLFLLKEKKVTLKQLLSDLWLHAVLVATYAVSWIIIKNLVYHSMNTDATIGTSYSLGERLKCILGYSFALFPLKQKKFSWKELLNQSFTLDIQSFLLWFFFIGVSIVIVSAIARIRLKINLKNYLAISIVCLLGCLLSNVLLCMTDRFVRWMLQGEQREWGPSYFSYFFIVLWMLITICFVYQHTRRKCLAKVIIVVSIALISMMTYVNNIVYIKEAQTSEVKYELTYNLIMHTDFFKSIEKDAQIYMPQYMGIHSSMDVISNFANRINGSSIIMTNKTDSLDFNRNVYEIKIDYDTPALYVGRINGDYTTDCIHVYSATVLDEYTATAERGADAYGMLKINDETRGMYGHYVIASGITCTDLWAKVDCESMIFDTFTLNYDGIVFENIPSGSLNKIINLSGDEWNGTNYINYGISHNEGAFTWSDGNEISLRPLFLENEPYILTLDYSLVFNSKQQIDIYANDELIYEGIITEPGSIAALIPASEDKVINLKIKLPDAISPYKLYESGQVEAPEDWWVSGDRRYLGLGLTRIAITRKNTNYDDHLVIHLSGNEWNGSSYIHYGISHNEGEFTWSDGHEISFNPLLFNDSQHILTLSYSTVFNSEQRIIAYVNDELIYSNTITEPGKTEILIPPCEAGPVNLKIELPDASSPLSEDVRTLALAFDSITIVPYEE